MHPILSQAQIWSLHNRLYAINNIAQRSRLDDDECFKLMMVFALGSAGIHYDGEYDKHPFGYFAAALESLLSSGFAFSTLSELQNFLLIARFGTLYYIGMLRASHFRTKAALTMSYKVALSGSLVKWP